MTWRKFAPSDTKWDCIETHKAVYSTKTWRLDTSSNNNILRCISNWCACYFLNMDVFALLTKTTTGFCSKHCENCLKGAIFYSSMLLRSLGCNFSNNAPPIYCAGMC